MSKHIFNLVQTLMILCEKQMTIKIYGIIVDDKKINGILSEKTKLVA